MLIYIQEIQYKEIQNERASKCKNVIFCDIRMQSKSPNFVYSTSLLIERRQKMSTESVALYSPSRYKISELTRGTRRYVIARYFLYYP